MEPEDVPEPGPGPLVVPPPDEITARLALRLARTSKIKVAVYQCNNPKCRAIDRYKHFDYEPTPSCINCWKCHNGRGTKSTEEAFATKRGMFLLRMEDLEGNVVQEGTVQ